MASVDKDYARQMQATVTLNPKPSVLRSDEPQRANTSRMERPTSRQGDAELKCEIERRLCAAGEEIGYPGDLMADVTVTAKPQLFKCLVGTKGDNLKKIRRECTAKIDVEGAISTSYAKQQWLCCRSQRC